MTETNTCVEKNALVDYLYREADADTKMRVQAHLWSCAQCADEVRELRKVRGTLEVWGPPEAELGFRLVSNAHPVPAPASFWGRFRRFPGWGLAAAAVLVLAAAAAIVKPEVQIGQGEMVVRFGWSELESDAAMLPGKEPASQSDLPTLEEEIQPLRGTAGPRSLDIVPVRGGDDLSAVPGLVPAADERLLRSVHQLISESEQRQERALAARVQQVEQLVADQRQADLTEMQRAFGEFEVTGAELARQQLLEYLRQVSTR